MAQLAQDPLEQYPVWQADLERITNRIVLIDGCRLAELMILHNVGVQDESTFVPKRIDEAFFEQS